MPVTRTELTAAIAERANLSHSQAESALTALSDVLVASVASGVPVKITGLMTVERVARAARTGRNPRTGEPLEIPAGFAVKISAGSTLKSAARC